MARSLSDLAASMRKRADAVETVGSRLAVIGARAAVKTLVWITPVDTTEHLSNWQVSLINPPDVRLEPYVPGHKGSTQGASAEIAISAAEVALKAKRPLQPLFISNLGPAIVLLDQGSSTQFPGGFVARARIAFSAAVAEAKAAGILFSKGAQ